MPLNAVECLLSYRCAHRAFAGTSEVNHTKVPSKVIAKLLLLSEQAKRIKSFLPEGADSLRVVLRMSYVVS